MGIFDFLAESIYTHKFKKKHGRRPNAKEWAIQDKGVRDFKKQIGRGRGRARGQKKKYRKYKIKYKINKLKPKKDSLYSESVIVNGLKYTRPT